MKKHPNLKVTIEPSGRSIPGIQAPPTPTFKPQTPSDSVVTMTERNLAERVPCTFPDCKFEFNSEAAMKRHKTLEPDHDYCVKCDRDFNSEEQLLIHMIKSQAHIVCPICGIEFRSEGGRDAHIRQYHRSSQNIICRGCNGTFRSASGLMCHIEIGECKVIPKEKLRYEQNKRLMLKETMEPLSPPMLRLLEGSIIDEDEHDGGVSLLDSPHEEKRKAITNQSKYGETVNEIMEKHWPSLGGKPSEENLKQTSLEEHFKNKMTLTEAVREKEKAEDDGRSSTAWKSEGRQPTAVGSDLTYQSQPASASTHSSSVVRPEAASVLNKIYDRWEPQVYVDQFTGEYVCPCGKRFRTEKAFEQHILNKNMAIRRINCPRCLRPFKSTAAFIAHCESSSTRCDVNEGEMYAQIIEEISGGMIRTAGHNEDGTMKYEAGDVEITKTVKIGRNWQGPLSVETDDRGI
ncbi:hypothetical protein BJX64DRAFT_283251 [Aspergillus heterothallicus]